ncbi:MAG: murein transglycosylase [Nitrosarchaeum sp.]|nr:murein transglycosylase [Nitrosarchaeum sp.]
MKIIFTVLVITLITVSIIPALSQSQIISNIDTTSTAQNCSDGWYITGYFLPIEINYSSKMIPILIDGKAYSFKNDFVNEVKIQGWGKTISGEYLGSYDGKFHFNSIPLDSLGNNLAVGSIAVDPQIIKPGTKITIPTLLPPWNQTVFDSNDVGPAIIGKHIDVYTGEGVDARKEAFRITGYDNSVCIVNNSTLTNQSPNVVMHLDNSTKKIPEWVKNIFIWYGQDQVSEGDLLNAIKFLINQGIIKIN